jgi:hypothetical protein
VFEIVLEPVPGYRPASDKPAYVLVEPITEQLGGLRGLTEPWLRTLEAPAVVVDSEDTAGPAVELFFWLGAVEVLVSARTGFGHIFARAGSARGFGFVLHGESGHSSRFGRNMRQYILPDGCWSDDDRLVSGFSFTTDLRGDLT